MNSYLAYFVGVTLGVALALGYNSAYASHGGEHNPYDDMTIEQALEVTDDPHQFWYNCMENLMQEAEEDDNDMDDAEQVEYCFAHLNAASQAATRLIISRAMTIGNDQCIYREMI